MTIVQSTYASSLLKIIDSKIVCTQKLAVVIPSYRVKNHILKVIQAIGPEVCRVYVVDDCCPERSGDFVFANCADTRVLVLRHEANLGVGAAVMTGYLMALEDGMEIIVKVDGDGQMDPALIPDLIAPILEGRADYTKGNRFFDLEKILAMPKVRILGNAALSFMAKISSGYWNLFDPTNGFTAIHRNVAAHLPFSKISSRYFFETDMLFRLNTLRAVVVDVPMAARYGGETSSLRLSRVAGEFFVKHLRNVCKRIFYNYYLRNMSIASIELPIGVTLLLFGCIFGVYEWGISVRSGVTASAGTVMLSALPVIVGLQFILSFLSYDISAVPSYPVHGLLRYRQSPHQNIESGN